MINESSIQPMCYRIAPELRRCALSALFGGLALTVLFYWIARFVQQRGGVEIGIGCTLFALLAVSMVVPLRWKLHVDEAGIACRRLFSWDRWSWNDFASGRIRKQYPFTLIDPARAWWQQSLWLHYMSESDVREVIELINRHYQMPPPSVVSDEITIKYGLRRSAKFDWRGIQLLIRNEPYDYQWSEVQRLHITRMDPLRRDFKTLELVLPDRELELKFVTHQGGTSPTWRGATAEEVNEFLLSYTPADSVDVDIAGDPPAKMADIEKRNATCEPLYRFSYRSLPVHCSGWQYLGIL